MKRFAVAFGIAIGASPVFAAPMEEACLARGTWDADTCTCMQGVADETLSPENQDLAVAFFAQQITSQQIAAQHGVAVAQDFLASIAGFQSASTEKCGAP